MVSVIKILVLLLFINGCCKVESLDLNKRSYSGKELKIDGYYFLERKDDRIEIFFLYKNGVLLYGEAPLKMDLPEFELKYMNNEYYNRIKEDQSAWGIFLIDNETIKFEKWEASECLKTYVRSGEIVDDTTFWLPNLNTGKMGVYMYKQFSPKPDSTNSFIP